MEPKNGLIMPNTLRDTFGRTHRDMRVSLTDRCSLRCVYCMPNDFSSWLPSSEILSSAEILKVVSIGVKLGISEVRLTGGEPLLRPDILEIVAAISKIPNAPQISLTTNGIKLAEFAQPLAMAGLGRINVSLDTLNRERFKFLTFRDRIQDVFQGLEEVKKTNLRPIKINSVLIRGVNDQEACDLLAWALHEGFELRFIEQMPLDAAGSWKKDQFVTATEIKTLLGAKFSLTEVPERGSAPAQEFFVNESQQKVGIIASVTQPFCGSCDRLRLTSDGQLRSCLFSKDETDIRSVLRNSDLTESQITSEIERRLKKTVIGKAKGHGVNDIGFIQPVRPMSAIGG